MKILTFARLWLCWRWLQRPTPRLSSDEVHASVRRPLRSYARPVAIDPANLLGSCALRRGDSQPQERRPSSSAASTARACMSCRAGDGWSAPVFLELAKGSWGFQAGAEEIDVVMLVMNESGVQKLLKNKVNLGADASVAAGPVGRQGQVGTDVSLTAEILAYSRAKGLFAGVNLSGGVLRPDEDANRDAYGTDCVAELHPGEPKPLGADTGSPVPRGIRRGTKRLGFRFAGTRNPSAGTAAVRKQTDDGDCLGQRAVDHGLGSSRDDRRHAADDRPDAERSEFDDGWDERPSRQHGPDGHGEPREARAAPKPAGLAPRGAERSGTVGQTDRI